MEINLKQPELFNAIKQYLERQGFKLRGKEVSISISSGRAPSGAYANVSIEEIEIPGFEQDSDDAPIIEMVNQEINQLVAEEQAATEDNLSPAPADATPAPVILADDVYVLVEEVAAIEVPPVPEEPSLEEPEDHGLFDAPLAHEPEQAKPAVTPSPSSLFDE